MPHQTEPMQLFVGGLAASGQTPAPRVVGPAWGAIVRGIRGVRGQWIRTVMAYAAAGYDLAGAVHHAQPDWAPAGSMAMGIAAGVILVVGAPLIEWLFDDADLDLDPEQEEQEARPGGPPRAWVLPTLATGIALGHAFFS